MQTTIDQRIDTVLTPIVADQAQTVLEFCPKEVIFFQGDREDHVLQIISGEVMLTMATLTGKRPLLAHCLRARSLVKKRWPDAVAASSQPPP